jgi:hypothetical protein
MFHTRITETWGAPAEIKDGFLLERKVELPGGLMLLCGRERASGIKRWVKFAASPDQDAALAEEAAALAACAHPRIAALVHDGGAGSPAWFAMEWQGETPLDDEAWQRLPAIDRLRLAPALVEAVEALAMARVALPGLSRNHLWVSPALRWLRLVGLAGAVAHAQTFELAEMRAAAAGLLREIAFEGGSSPAETNLSELISKWGASEESVVSELTSELDRALLMAVTADL